MELRHAVHLIKQLIEKHGQVRHKEALDIICHESTQKITLEDKHIRFLISCRENGLSLGQITDFMLNALQESNSEGEKNRMLILDWTTCASEKEFESLAI